MLHKIVQIQKVLSEGSNFDNDLKKKLVNDGSKDPASHHRPDRETPFKWCFAGGPMMAQH